MNASNDSDLVVSVTKFVPAPASEIFELLADPRRHAEIDGSGTIQSARVKAPARLSLGAKFGMKMKIGVPYLIMNKVVEFEEGKQIAWCHFGGHRWRYILEPADGGTNVTEQFDMSTAKNKKMEQLMKAPARNRVAIEKTLEKLAARFAK